jgi:pimeloyl-ACP methyl ester carboxylesterase
MTRSACALALCVGAWASACSEPPRQPPPVHEKACASTFPGLTTECGTVTVFEDRASAKGRTLEINFAVARTGAQRSPEALTYLAGGPGEGAVGGVGAAAGWLKPVRDTMDVLFVDQRGSGESNPLRCQSDAATNPASAFGHVFDPMVFARCRTELKTKADLTKYTTDLAAADLDDVRAALGYERLSIYGVSYGTRMAQAYMRRFPTHTRSVVIDGVGPVDVNLPLSYAASAQQSLERVFAAVSVPDVSKEFDSLLRRLDAGPIEATVVARDRTPAKVRMSRGDFAYAVRGLLYGANAVRALPEMIAHAAASGNLDAFAQAYYQRDIAMERAIADGLHLSVLCAEDVPFATDAEINTATNGTFIGRYLFDEYRNACKAWPRAAIAGDARTPVTTRVPTLLISGYFDPVTPPEFAERVARSLPIAKTIVAPAGAHGSTLDCPLEAAIHVLQRGTVDDMPQSCR